MQQNSPLEELKQLPEYFAGRAHIFPTKNAGEWFIRQHKSELVKAGALTMLAGRWMAAPDKMDAAVLQIGTRAAEKAVA